ncbi:MAG: Lipid A biosynthesis lauroyltransferase [Planctomycetes bacterium]|nr:Lipid A biosynthesis lauroyltransferase [Planctomycetota bacterium]GIK52012.1 MAG: lipid A biosynthesis lauroyltransferase [Planctomycetota bacterium]HRJ77364.1 hypothetical protein [Planctomycetota bacterium]
MSPQTKKQRKKSRSRKLQTFWLTRWPLEAFLWVGAQFIFSFGWRWAYFWARRIAWIMWVFMARQRAIALRNIELCLPELDEARRRQVARESFKHTVYAFFDMLLIERTFKGDRWKRHVTVDDSVRRYYAWAQEGRAPLTTAGHFGSWEVGVFVNHAHGMEQAALYRPPDLPIFDRWLRRMRAFCGVVPIEKEGGLRQLLKRARDNQPLLAILDQYGGDSGYAAPYFGVNTRWQADVFKVFLRNGLKLCVSECVRRGDTFHVDYRVLLMREFPPEADVGEVIRAYAQTLEEMVRRHPEQYFWLHKRFKTRKEGEPDRYANPGSSLSQEQRQAMIA